MFAVQPSAVVVMVGAVLPVDWVKITPPAPIVEEYLTESAKYASSAVTRLRRSDFIEARYAFSFVLANFGIAIAAKMPMMTTTISSSMSVKPFRLRSMCISRRMKVGAEAPTDFAGSKGNAWTSVFVLFNALLRYRLCSTDQ